MFGQMDKGSVDELPVGEDPHQHPVTDKLQVFSLQAISSGSRPCEGRRGRRGRSINCLVADVHC